MVVMRLEMEERQWLMRARREVMEVCRRSMSAVRDEGGILVVDLESGCQVICYFVAWYLILVHNFFYNLRGGGAGQIMRLCSRGD